MTDFDLGLLPSGHLHCFPADADDAPGITEHEAKVFSRSIGKGLFALAARKNSNNLTPSLQYWRSFARQYINERCMMPQVVGAAGQHQPEPVKPFTDIETMPLLMGAPPMRGAEYLSGPVLQDIRSLLDTWVCEQIETLGGLDVLLAQSAPQWHQVGRVCLHLAENKGDPDFPFAFMASYAPELSEQGRIRYQPLGHALQEYAGEQ